MLETILPENPAARARVTPSARDPRVEESCSSGPRERPRSGASIGTRDPTFSAASPPGMSRRERDIRDARKTPATTP
jgi:hypothetical protein